MNSIKNSEKFNSLVKELASRLFHKKMNEITTTASIDTYQTPYAFGKKLSKKRKKNIEKQNNDAVKNGSKLKSFALNLFESMKKIQNVINVFLHE